MLDAGGLLALRQAVTQVEIHPSIYRYTVKLAAATRDHPDIAVGVSPRGTLALTRVAQAVAMAAGRSFVLPDDVDLCFLDVCAHRVSLQPRAAAQGKTAEQVLQGVLQEVPTPAVAAAQLGGKSRAVDWARGCFTHCSWWRHWAFLPCTGGTSRFGACWCCWRCRRFCYWASF